MGEINTWFLWDIRIDEPIVTVTDLLVSVLCFLFAIKLHRRSDLSSAQQLFKFYFLMMGIATTLGGVFGHAFLYAMPFAMKLPGWITSMFAIMLIERAAIQHTRIVFKPKVIKILGIINIVEFLTFLTLTIVSLDFFFVEFHSGYGLMFVVLSLEGYLFFKTRNNASLNILIGIGLAAIAALFFMNEWTPHQWFNHIATSHIFMAIAAYFFYKGAKNIDMHRDAITVN
ncbi:MAG: hypothetical protein WEC59_07560 [Salibacteraceae bacterium]